MKTVLLTLVALGVATVVARADTLVIKGSDTLGAKLVPQLAEEFKAQHPGTTFNIAAEGSTTGISAIIDDTAPIGMSSRPTKPEQIAQEVGKNPNGAGYVGLAYVKASGIKVVAIDGAMPSKESVLGKAYPYARPTFYYTNGEPTGLAKQFVDFTVSDAGQKIVEQVGFVPIK